MSDAAAYWNGSIIPAADLWIDVHDGGFVQGVTIAEQMRTFGGQLYRLDDHLDRLAQSLECLGLQLPVGREELAAAAHVLVARNHRLLTPGDDLGLSLFVTPGRYAGFGGRERGGRPSVGPNVGMHTYGVAFDTFASKYTNGQSLVLTSVRQVPENCWPATLKCRSRMHYFLADREARQRDPAARALLLDQQGLVMEASTANVLIYREGEGLFSPPWEKILQGISLLTLRELTIELGFSFRFADLFPSDVATADEVLLCSTSPCILPVTRFEGRPIGTGRPGPTYEKLLRAWSERVGVDIAAQARQFAAR